MHTFTDTCTHTYIYIHTHAYSIQFLRWPTRPAVILKANLSHGIRIVGSQQMACKFDSFRIKTLPNGPSHCCSTVYFRICFSPINVYKRRSVLILFVNLSTGRLQALIGSRVSRPYNNLDRIMLL